MLGNILDELIRDVLGCIEVTVAWGVEWEIDMGFAAVILAICHSAEIPKGPARCCRGACNIACVDLEEVDLVQRRGVTSTGQKSQED